MSDGKAIRNTFEKAARDGVKIANASRWEPMVILQHFGPNNREMPKEVPA